MREAINASSFVGYWGSCAMLPGNDTFSSECATVESTPWLPENIDPSILTATLAPLDVQTTLLPDDTIFPLDPASDFVPSEITTRFNNHIFETPQASTSQVCFQAPLAAQVDSHQASSPNDQTTTPQLRPDGSQFNLYSPPRPKRRGRPRIYPRPDDEYHLQTAAHPSSSNHAGTSTREQNRLAAQRFRARHDAHAVQLNTQAAILASENKALKTMVTSLREEALGLRYDVLKHADCGCGVWERYVEGRLGRMGRVREEVEGQDGEARGSDDREVTGS